MSNPNGTEFVEGSLVSFNVGDGWRCGYLLKIRETRGDVQPIGVIGKIPSIVTCNLADIRLEPNQSVKWPTVDDFYRANKRTAPVVLLAAPSPAAKSWNDYADAVMKRNPITKTEEPPLFIHGEKDDATFAAKIAVQKAKLTAPAPAPAKKERAGREQIEEMIRAGVSYRKISAACGVSLGHITTVKKEMVTP